MNGQDPGNAPAESNPLPAPYKNQSTGLIVFGVLTILGGCLAGLFFVGMVAQTVFVRNPEMSNSMILSSVSIYAVLAVALVWLGIGSIMARRWARALLLVFSWSWLCIGVLTLVGMAFMLPAMMAAIRAGAKTSQPLPSAAMGAAMVFMFLFMGVIFVILPAVWAYFYSRPSVKATCEARDATARWTDACPLPVLAVSLWLMASLPTLLVMAVTGHLALPFFGTFLTGFASTGLCVALAAVCGYLAWSFYKLQWRGWWLLVAIICLSVMSHLITFSRHDLLEMYRLMDFPQAQLDQMQQIGLLAGQRILWMTVLGAVPLLGYLLFLRKFFKAV